MAVRIAHLSDTHLGARPRAGIKQHVWGVEMRARLLENDFYERFAEIFDIIAELDPPVDLVVHSGDLYNSPWEGNPTQPPVMAQTTALSVIKNFIEKTGIPVILLEGNHGLYRLLEVSLLESLKMAIPGIEVATQQDLKRAFSNDEPLVFSFDNVDVFCFPFMDRNVLESSDLLPDFNAWILNHQKPSPDKASVALAHGMTLDETLYTPVFDVGYDYIALGHDHHQHKHAKNAWYAGSPERWRFDEAKYDKGFLVVEINPGKKPKVKPYHLEFKRMLFNESIKFADDETVDSALEKIDSWFDSKGLKSGFDPETAARVRLVLEGGASRISPLELRLAMESFRMKILEKKSDYNVSQLVWNILSSEFGHEAVAYPEIESEYLIENPESDFKDYLGGLKIEEKFDVSILTKIAVGALKIAVGRGDEKLTIESVMEEGEE